MSDPAKNKKIQDPDDKEFKKLPESPPIKDEEAVQPFDAEVECGKLLATIGMIDGALLEKIESTDKALSDRITEVTASVGRFERIFPIDSDEFESSEIQEFDILSIAKEFKTLNKHIENLYQNDSSVQDQINKLKESARKETNRLNTLEVQFNPWQNRMLDLEKRVEFLEKELRPDQTRRLEIEKERAQNIEKQTAKENAERAQNQYGGSDVTSRTSPKRPPVDPLKKNPTTTKMLPPGMRRD